MRNTKLTTTLLLMAFAAAPAAWAGQFGDYNPHGFLSDYSKLKPEGGDSHAYKYRDPKADGAKVFVEKLDRKPARRLVVISVNASSDPEPQMDASNKQQATSSRR